MNLIEARKAAHEGWVRSETRTGGVFIRFTHSGYESGDEKYGTITAGDLDADNWEPKPKPKPVEPFEVDVWLLPNGRWAFVYESDSDEVLKSAGWRRIRVREVVG
jgi:hypothetical protein